MNDSPKEFYPSGPAPEYDAAGNPTPEWRAAYEAWLADALGESSGSWWPPSWLRLPRRRTEAGELAEMASTGTEVAPLSGVVVPRETGPAVPTSPPDLPGPVSKGALVWDLLGQYAELGRERFSAAAERRSVERSEALPLVRDARKAVRAAKRVDPDGTQVATRTAERQLAAAKSAVPQSMAQVVVEGIAAAGAAGTAAWYELLPRMTEAAWLWTGGGLVAVTVGGVAWLVDKAGGGAGLAPTREERALLMRLRPQHWLAHAEARGLGGTLVGNAHLTMSGIEVAVRLDGKWTPKGLADAEDHIRALLGAASTLRMQVEAGDRGGWARLILRTRSAADGVRLDFDYADESTWNLGMDAVTGKAIPAPLGRRALVAGKTGAGKSVASRTLLFLASEGETEALIIIDLKQVEGRLWDHRARVAFTPAAIIAVCEEVGAEMRWRLGKMPKGQTDWNPTAEHPRITLVVDEGAEVIKAVKDVIEELESVAAMGRAPEVILVWMTQKPTMSGTGYGIPSLVAAQMDVRICLRVTTAGEARTVLGDDATGAGYNAHELPIPGWAHVRGDLPGLVDAPHPIRIRYMSNKQVLALPDRRIWRRGAAELPAPRREDDALGVVQEPAALPAADVAPSVAAGLTGNDARVLDALVSAGEPLRQAAIADATGLNKGTVSKAVGRLVEAGTLSKNPDGTISPSGH